jgi:hypothetical protein
MHLTDYAERANCYASTDTYVNEESLSHNLFADESGTQVGFQLSRSPTCVPLLIMHKTA